MKEKQNKNDILDVVSERSHVNKKDTQIVIEELFLYIEECMKNNEEVNIKNFGVFVPKVREKRKGTHPKNHSEIAIPEKRSISLRLSKNLKKNLNN